MEHKIPFNLDALIVFTKVVEAGSMSKAASLLGMPKSTVSRQVGKLEHDLGAQLLQKNTRSLSVTDFGLEIHRYSQSILEQAQSIQALSHQQAIEPQGTLKAAIPVSLGGTEFVSVLGKLFLTQYPKASLELQLVDRLVHPVNEGFDLAICYGPLQDSTLHARKLFSTDIALCASPALIEQSGGLPEKPADLNRFPMVASGISAANYKLVLSKGNQSYEATPPLRAKINSFTIIKNYVLEGLGAGALVRHECIEEITNGDLVPLLPDWRLPNGEAYMVYSSRLSSSNLIAAFCHTIEQLIGGEYRNS